MDIADTPIKVPGLTDQQAQAVLRSLRDMFCVCTGCTVDETLETAKKLIVQHVPNATNEMILPYMIQSALQTVATSFKAMSDDLVSMASDPARMAKIAEQLKANEGGEQELKIS